MVSRKISQDVGGRPMFLLEEVTILRWMRNVLLSFETLAWHIRNFHHRSGHTSVVADILGPDTGLRDNVVVFENNTILSDRHIFNIIDSGFLALWKRMNTSCFLPTYRTSSNYHQHYHDTDFPNINGIILVQGSICVPVWWIRLAV
jgi:hypothetical protein